MMTLSSDLLDILACPQCKEPVALDETSNVLVCHSCLVSYPIRDDIPVMLIDESSPLPCGTKTETK